MTEPGLSIFHLDLPMVPKDTTPRFDRGDCRFDSCWGDHARLVEQADTPALDAGAQA
jgi:hypothetical protein